MQFIRGREAILLFFTSRPDLSLLIQSLCLLRGEIPLNIHMLRVLCQGRHRVTSPLWPFPCQAETLRVWCKPTQPPRQSVSMSTWRVISNTTWQAPIRPAEPLQLATCGVDNGDPRPRTLSPCCAADNSNSPRKGSKYKKLQPIVSGTRHRGLGLGETEDSPPGPHESVNQKDYPSPSPASESLKYSSLILYSTFRDREGHTYRFMAKVDRWCQMLPVREMIKDAPS